MLWLRKRPQRCRLTDPSGVRSNPLANILITGASRGLGAAFATGLPEAGDTVWALSRSLPAWLEPAYKHRPAAVQYHWIEADLAADNMIEHVVTGIGESPIDLLLYNAGIWEATAFSDQYDFEKIDPAEHHQILQVNLTAAIDLVQAVLPNVRQAAHGKMVIIGSTSGLPNSGAPEVAYGVSKWGLAGLVHTLREITRPDGIGVTVVHPGYIATEIPLDEEAERLPTYDGRWGMPMSDLLKLVKTVLTLSPHACVKEIVVPAMRDRHT